MSMASRVANSRADALEFVEGDAVADIALDDRAIYWATNGPTRGVKKIRR